MLATSSTAAPIDGLDSQKISTVRRTQVTLATGSTFGWLVIWFVSRLVGLVVGVWVVWQIR